MERYESCSSRKSYMHHDVLRNISPRTKKARNAMGKGQRGMHKKCNTSSEHILFNGHWVRRLHFPVVRLLLKMIESSQMRKPRLTTRKLCYSSASKTCIWDGKMKPRAAAQASGEGAAGAESLRPALSVCIFCTRNLNVSSSSFHFLLPRFPAGPKTFLSVRHHLSGERRWLGPPDFALSLSFPLFLSGI